MKLVEKPFLVFKLWILKVSSTGDRIQKYGGTIQVRFGVDFTFIYLLDYHRMTEIGQITYHVP